MAEAVSRTLCRLALLLVLLAFPSGVFAHRDDQYLQATLVAIEPSGVRTLRMDGRKLELKLTASEFVPPAELRTGSGTIQMEFSAISGPLAAGPHRLTLENGHLTAMSVYLINAAQPRFAAIQIARQKRNQNQSAGEIEFTFHPFRPKNAESGARP
jgi:hypothetical protein